MIKEKIDNFAWREYEDVIETVHKETVYNITNLQAKIEELQTEYDKIDAKKTALFQQINDLKAKVQEGITTGVINPKLPTLNLTATPTSIAPGASTVLNWSADKATSCSASWTTSTDILGSKAVNPAITTIYQMTCIGPAGNITKQVTVTVA